MAEHRPASLGPEVPLALLRRAAYRRILALLKGAGHRFVVGGSLGIARQIGRQGDGELEIYLPKERAEEALASLSAAGFEVEKDDGHARVEYGDEVVRLAWSLPPPLRGAIDEEWFRHARRMDVVDVRVRVAPPEELLWLQLATLPPESLCSPLAMALLLERGPALDWPRVMGRLAGLEELLLAHIFLLRHCLGNAAMEAIPAWVITALIAKLDASCPSLEKD